MPLKGGSRLQAKAGIPQIWFIHHIRGMFICIEVRTGWGDERYCPFLLEPA
jgi:hypothetical protein